LGGVNLIYAGIVVFKTSALRHKKNPTALQASAGVAYFQTVDCLKKGKRTSCFDS
jgi:hypothetical protein